MQSLIPIQVVNNTVYSNISLGTTGTVGAFILNNESAFTLIVAYGSFTYFQPAFTVNLYDTSVGGFDGTCTISTSSSSVPAGTTNTLYFTVFAPGENIPGTYPYGIVRQTQNNVTQASTLINNSLPSGSPIISATPASGTPGSLSISNIGEYFTQNGSITTQTGTISGSAIVGTTYAQVGLGPAPGAGSSNFFGSLHTFHGTINLENNGLIDFVNGFQLRRMAIFSGNFGGAGSAVFAHNLGIVPQIILLQRVGSGVPGVAVELMYDNTTVTTTNVTIFVSGAIFFVGLAIG
jgi:hypothetical protein